MIMFKRTWLFPRVTCSDPLFRGDFLQGNHGMTIHYFVQHLSCKCSKPTLRQFTGVLHDGDNGPMHVILPSVVNYGGWRRECTAEVAVHSVLCRTSGSCPWLRLNSGFINHMVRSTAGPRSQGTVPRPTLQALIEERWVSVTRADLSGLGRKVFNSV